ncbi:MAG: glycosyltransferase, partial [Candidatus Peregrinibacteria bacterium]|nr:glycosyltransferase [Candidatus Peregrinibacteria bacterium]
FPRERVRTSTLQPRFPLSAFRFPLNHHIHLSRFPSAVEQWNFNEYDVVISTSSAFTHNIITNGKPKHLSYINAPARYLWDRTFDVQKHARHGLFGPLKQRYLQKTFHKLRAWDAECAGRADKLIAASNDVQRRIELYWRRESDVIYPPIDDFWLKKVESGKRKAERYFLIVSTLVPYKQIDIAIDACNKINAPLKIVGEGPDRKRLEQRTNHASQITFLGYQEQESLKELYTNASALLFPGIEDFGIAPLEAMACGTPVISFRAGGPLETIVEGKTGLFFDEQTPQSLADVLQIFNASAFDAELCKAQAQQFSREKFEIQMKQAVSNLML